MIESFCLKIFLEGEEGVIKLITRHEGQRLVCKHSNDCIMGKRYQSLYILIFITYSNSILKQIVMGIVHLE